MATFTPPTAAPTPSPELAKKVHELQELFADAPEVAKAALANAKRSGALASVLQSSVPQESAGRAGRRQGRVSEFTVIAPFVAGGAERLRRFLKLVDGSFIAEKIGTLHDKRFVFLDNDTRLLFATTY